MRPFESATMTVRLLLITALFSSAPFLVDIIKYGVYSMKEVTFHLEVFDGPLDLLLHLLSKNKVEITDIPIAEILEQ